mmetsp:Transcript_182718/g.578850  ORF Transcript_182718/g.578850 Transcript_182718/m.578850 type:complete len:234 (-) Transcript_182718:485-1186(-)
MSSVPLHHTGQVLRVLVVRGLESGQLLGMLVGGIAQHRLDVGEPLAHIRMMLGRCGGVVGQGVRMLPMRLLEGDELLDMPVRRVAEQLLEVLQALAHRGVLRMERLQGVEVLGLLAVPERKLRVSLAQRLEFLRVLVGRIAQQLLEEDHPLRQGGMMVVSFLQVRDIACVLVVRGLQCFQLLGVLVGGVPQQLLNILHTLLNRRMILGRGLQALGMLVMSILQSLQLLHVLVR